MVINKFPLNSEAENLLTKTKIYGKAAEKGVGREKNKTKSYFFPSIFVIKQFLKRKTQISFVLRKKVKFSS